MGSPIGHGQLGWTGLLRDLVVALRPGHASSHSSSELLDEHEKSLRDLYPNGAPSGDGSEQFDWLVALRREEAEWQIRHRRRLQTLALAGAILSLAVAGGFAWGIFAA
jgi:hypothetical protein